MIFQEQMNTCDKDKWENTILHSAIIFRHQSKYIKKKKNRGATLATLIVCCSIASCIVALSCSLMLPTEVGLAQYQALISIIGGKLFCYWWSVLQIKSLVICIEYKITSSNNEWFHAEITCQIHQCNKALHLPEQGLQLPTSTPLFTSKTLIRLRDFKIMHNFIYMAC